MKCPSCTTTSLVMTDRSSIEIDYCPDCRGVWLDRGELDKIIERSEPAARRPEPSVQVAAAPVMVDGSSRGGPSRREWDDDDDDDRPRYTNDGRSGGKRRSKGFLGELFEF